MPGARWFEGANLNYAEHIFRGKDKHEVAVVYASELRELSELRWGELREQVAAVREGLQALGVSKGDRVVAYLPNGPEALIAFLATASLGAIWSSCSPDFGPGSVIDRFAQIEPKVMFAVDGYRYGGKDFDRMEVVADVAAQIPSLERVVVVPYLSASPELSTLEERPKVAPPMTWGQLADLGSGAELRFERVPFDHPLWVLYSSGTTGLPKAIVHGHGGILMEQLKKGYLHLDAQPGDRLFWFTTTGWMMWNFLIGVLLTPASIVLYDGNPAYPDMGVLWDLAERTGETCFGTSAAYIAACMKDGVEPGRDATSPACARSAPPAPRSPPRASTGSTSTSARTPGSSRPAAGPTSAPRSSAASRSCPCTRASSRAAPSAPRSRPSTRTATPWSTRSASWSSPSRCPRCRSSSGATRTARATAPATSRCTRASGATATGSRSPRAARRSSTAAPTRPSTAAASAWGPAEIYRAVADVPEVLDSLVVDIPRPGTEGWMPLFVVLREGVELDDELVGEIKRRIREQCSPRHVPNEIFQIAEVPRTLSGKVLEVPVKRILMGEPAREGGEPRLAGEPGRARLLHGARRPPAVLIR